MARLSLLALLGLSLVGTALANEQVTVSGGSVHTYNGWSYEDCGSPEDAVQIKSISVSPDPPKAGENLEVTVTGVVERKIDEGAYADITVKLGLVKLLQKRFDICEEARNANATVKCPVAEDEYTIAQVVELPKEIPPAKFVIQVRGYSVDDDDLLCLNLKADFTKKFPGMW